jgi:hypothetical protein
MIFLFFMITDPKTVPGGQVGRVAFGMLVAIASTLLLAPQTNEWATKVALLGGLVVICAARPLLDRILPEPKSAADDLRRFGARLAGTGTPARGVARGAMRAIAIAIVVLLVGAGIVLAGTPARGLVVADNPEALDTIPRTIDPSTFPAITIGQDVADWDHSIAESGARDIVVTLAENLEVENQALLRHDPSMLPAVDHGDRLTEMQARLAAAQTSGRTVVDHYRFDSLAARLIVPFGVQTGLSLGFDSTGTLTEETYDAAGNLVDRHDAPFDLTFAMRRATGDRWLTVGVLPPKGG